MPNRRYIIWLLIILTNSDRVFSCGSEDAYVIDFNDISYFERKNIYQENRRFRREATLSDREKCGPGDKAPETR